MKMIITVLAVCTVCSWSIVSESRATTLTDLKFGQYQIADSQWNVSACMYTTTCQIYSKNPGTAYRIPWTAGKLSWASGDYLRFTETGDAANPWLAVQYTVDDVQKSTMGTGRIINIGADYFFFVGNDNNTGQLFSMTVGFSDGSGLTWTGTLNPTVEQVNQLAAGGSTTPLAPGQTASPPPTLCCGGSAASFTMNDSTRSSVERFRDRANPDSQVWIEQIGDSNQITVTQSGTFNNYAEYRGVGSHNRVDIVQQGSGDTVSNYTQLQVTGDHNTIEVVQSGAGAKAVASVIDHNNNHLTVVQDGGGRHWADVILSGGGKSVDITQTGNGDHHARVELSGGGGELNLTQQGATGQYYSIQHHCGNGCGTITIIQGQ